MKKRFWLLTTAVILAVLMLAMPMMVSAQAGGVDASSTAAVWDGTVAEEFAGGKGTKEDPYQITSGGHLALLADTINLAGGIVDLGGLYFKVMNDIDMNGKPIMPIGGDYDGVYFSGYFDGNNKTISNLNLICETVYSGIWDDSRMFQNVGLFGCVKNAVIRNVVLKDLYKTGGVTAQTWFNAGALVGKAIDSQIINCHVDSDLVFECCRPSSQTSIYAGGMIGFLQDNGTVKGCTYDGTLRVNGRADFEDDGANRVAVVAGGLIGRLDGDIVTADTLVTIEDCAVSGTMLSIGKTYHLFWGGMVGIAYNGWGAADDSTDNPIILYMKNCISTVTMDVSAVDMSYTPNANNYMNCGGIVSQTGSFCMDLENVHFIGDLSSAVAANGMNIRETKVAGIVYNPRSNSTYSNVTTNFDKVTINKVQYTDDTQTVVKNEENWKGNWDRETCAVNTSEKKDSVLALIASNIAAIDSYDDGYSSDDFDIDNPFDAPTTGMCGNNVPWNLNLETKTLTIYGTGDIYDYNISDYFSPWIAFSADIETVVISEGITGIGNYAFYCCRYLKNIVIPDSVTYIGEGAFQGCESLTAIDIPEGITKIKVLTFDGCINLTEIELPSTLEYIGAYAFLGCEKLESLKLPEAVCYIDFGAFYNCESLTDINIPYGIDTVYAHTFHGCSSLKLIALPWSVTGIDGGAFQGCSSLEEVVIPCSVGFIGDGAFRGCTALTHVIYGGDEGDLSIGSYNDALIQSIVYTGKHLFSDDVWFEMSGDFHVRNCISCGMMEYELHSWNTSIVIEAPTVYENGVEMFFCDKCDANKFEVMEKLDEHTFGDFIIKNDKQHAQYCACGEEKLSDHKWGEAVTVIAATHTNEGCATYKCADCGATKIETIAKLADHTFGILVSKGDKHHVKVCACGEEQTADHKWGEGVETTAATHFAVGVKTYTCTDCGTTKTEAIAKLTDHTFGGFVKKDDKQHVKACACGEVQIADHKWGEAVTVISATHTTEGCATYQCADCGAAKIETIAKLTTHTYGAWTDYSATQHSKICACGSVEYADHAWDNGIVTTAATHLAEGVKTYTCADCGTTKTEAVAKLTTHTYGAWADYSATQHSKVCACGSVEYADHAWDNGIVTTAATHLADGVKTYTCAGCGMTKTEAVAKLTDHTFGDFVKKDAKQHVKVCACGEEVVVDHAWGEAVTIIAATHTTEGCATCECTDCGATKIETIAKLADHTYGAWENKDDSQHAKYCDCGEAVLADHTWNEGIVTSNPTEVAEGIKTFTCTDCGATRTEKVDKLPETVVDASGCSGSVSLGVGAFIVLCLGAAAILPKKRRSN